jgi:thiol-disulfide isomerase/thioredoxin
LKIITLFFLLSYPVFSQNEQKQDSVLFSEMLAIHHSDFQEKSSLHYHLGNYESSEEFFTSLVNNKLKGTTLDNFKVFSFNGKTNFIYELEKPFYLMSYASWCVPSNGEIEALEQLVSEHSSWMDFVLILWAKKEDAMKFSKQFPSEIKVLYVNELYNTETKTIKILKHKLGVPVSLTVSRDKTILNIRKNPQIHPSVDSDIAKEACYTEIQKDITLLQAYNNL